MHGALEGRGLLAAGAVEGRGHGVELFQVVHVEVAVLSGDHGRGQGGQTFLAAGVVLRANPEHESEGDQGAGRRRDQNRTRCRSDLGLARLGGNRGALWIRRSGAAN